MSKVESFQMEIPQLGRTRTVWVYLPTGYKKRGQPYPVIYMHDGQNIFYDHLTAYGTAWHADQTMEKIQQLTGMSAIVVGVECNSERRLSEYSPWKTSLPLKNFARENRGGEGDQYADFFANTLKAEIDSKYNTDPSRLATAVIGSSMGGLISLYIGLKYQPLYETMGIFSPFTPFNASAVRKFLKVTPQILPQHALVYCGGKESISVSDKTMEKASIELYNQLSARQVVTELLFNSDMVHNERAWDIYFRKFAYDFLARYNFQKQ